jgi:hypothetical protein
MTINGSACRISRERAVDLAISLRDRIPSINVDRFRLRMAASFVLSKGSPAARGLPVSATTSGRKGTCADRSRPVRGLTHVIQTSRRTRKIAVPLITEAIMSAGVTDRCAMKCRLASAIAARFCKLWPG